MSSNVAIAEHRALSALMGHGLNFEKAREALQAINPVARFDLQRFYDLRDIDRAARAAKREA